MSRLWLSSGRGAVYLTAVQTSAPVAFSTKLFQHALMALRMALGRFRRASWTASGVLFFPHLSLPRVFPELGDFFRPPPLGSSADPPSLGVLV